MEISGICKPAELQYGLGTLDTVEDVRVQKSSKRHKIFISRSSPGRYALQLTNGMSQKSYRGVMVELHRFSRSLAFDRICFQ
jgi:hypothetical protein